MKSQLLCFPCTVRTAYDIATKATDDKNLQYRIVEETTRWLIDHPNLSELNPAAIHTRAFRISTRISGNPDPFRHLKKFSNEMAMKVLPVLEREIKKMESFKDRFRFAVLGAICGNAIDFEVENYAFSLENIEPFLLNCLKGEFAIDETARLMEILLESKKVLYLLDNAGEIVFDKFLIKLIADHYPVTVWAAVKSRSILNDATMEDATQIGLGEVASVITTGSDHIGLKLDESSKDFLEHLRNADLIIAKGQGHLESIQEVIISKPIAYILRAKCILIAKELGVPHHGNVVKVVS